MGTDYYIYYIFKNKWSYEYVNEIRIGHDRVIDHLQLKYFFHQLLNTVSYSTEKNSPLYHEIKQMQDELSVSSGPKLRELLTLIYNKYYDHDAYAFVDEYDGKQDLLEYINYVNNL